MDLKVLCDRLGVELDHQLLELALTHRSYSYENGNTPNNERLEFLGDSVLGFLVTAHIHELLTELPEGELTKIKNAVVSARALAGVSAKVGLGEFMRLGKGEDQTGGREKLNLLADTFEAILGAVFVSKGLEEATGLVQRFIFPLLDDTDALRENSDPKTTLQEKVQGLGLGAVTYETESEGPDHDLEFHSKAIISGKVLGEGDAKSRKAAETEAAIAALKNI